MTEQPPYNLLDRRVENELVPMALKYGLGLLPWSPLAMGVLAGRYADDNIRPEGSRAVVARRHLRGSCQPDGGRGGQPVRAQLARDAGSIRRDWRSLG